MQENSIGQLLIHSIFKNPGKLNAEKSVLPAMCGKTMRSAVNRGPDAFRNAIDGLVVGCECKFAWYWLADLCEDESIPFALGHTLYVKAIHGGKLKNDPGEIAGMLRDGMFPMAFVYPRHMPPRSAFVFTPKGLIAS
jgi:hypothetical protein